MRFSWVAPSNKSECENHGVHVPATSRFIFYILQNLRGSCPNQKRSSGFIFARKNPKPLYFLTFLQIRLKLQCSYSIIFETIKSNRIQEIVI